MFLASEPSIVVVVVVSRMSGRSGSGRYKPLAPPSLVSCFLPLFLAVLFGVLRCVAHYWRSMKSRAHHIPASLPPSLALSPNESDSPFGVARQLLGRGSLLGAFWPLSKCAPFLQSAPLPTHYNLLRPPHINIFKICTLTYHRV